MKELSKLRKDLLLSAMEVDFNREIASKLVLIHLISGGAGIL